MKGGKCSNCCSKLIDIINLGKIWVLVEIHEIGKLLIEWCGWINLSPTYINVDIISV